MFQHQEFVDKFNKIYVVDTNIILDDANNILLLADNGTNLIVLTETVIDEIDNNKDMYQAREFNRMLSEAVIESVDSSGEVYIKYKDIYIMIIPISSIQNHNIELFKTLKNDEKIINVASMFLRDIVDIDKVIFISNDVGFRTKCVLKKLKTEPLLRDQKIIQDFSGEYYYDDCLPNKEYFSKDDLEKLLDVEIPNRYSYVKIIEQSGKPFYFIRVNGGYEKLDPERSTYIHNIKPKNLEQHVLLNLCTNDKSDIVVVNGVAGTGKTLMFLLAALKLIDLGKHNKITYIRKTIISGNQLDEIGFLPGNLQEKMLGYLYPLKDNLELIITESSKKKKKKEKLTKQKIEELIETFENEYNINYEYLGHLRGRTLDGIIILDEAQNYSVQDLITILSRIKDGSKVFIGGSIKQIDNPYLNKYNNGLTFMMNQVGTRNPNIVGMNLTKVERGMITDWIEKITQK